ncbi:hypothetical protein ACIFOT_15225 [Neobacillus sp. NRS-1170]|uniref:hypothetical protein n=1 Tax=Neobacillus sp. NRS-1170 TaxID=3233898 RepID=UPI003D2767BA
MKIRFTLVTVLSLISILLFGAVAFAATDFTQNGFPKVVAEKKIEAGEAARISHSGIKITIPEGTFSHDVTFQVLEGDNSFFQTKAPAGETVVMNFAFRVIDMETNQLIGAFNKPLTFSFKDKDINSGSIYYNFKLDGTLANNNAASSIEGRTLSHPVGGAPVGWVITSPSNSIKK